MFDADSIVPVLTLSVATQLLCGAQSMGERIGNEHHVTDYLKKRGKETKDEIKIILLS